jgi:hypothetical protein
MACLARTTPIVPVQPVAHQSAPVATLPPPPPYSAHSQTPIGWAINDLATDSAVSSGAHLFMAYFSLSLSPSDSIS